ncbi:MAG: glucose-1-phosphate cytidylyltransferase [Pseudomonadota bacterium]
MKVGILAGGFGTRLAEETTVRPKPMVEIGGMPIIWHIMKIYASYGIRDFSVALGYKGEYIKRWFQDYAGNRGSMSVDLATGEVQRHQDSIVPNWNVNLVETGSDSMTGGRIKRLQPWIGDSTCMVTYGDGLAQVDIDELLAFHRRHGKLATMTAVRPPARFGFIETDGDMIVNFAEKEQSSEGWINGGFFVLEPEAFDYIDGDATVFEQDPLKNLARDGQLMAYREPGFWQCMDTLPEKQKLEKLWDGGQAPWKVWE